MRLTYHPEVEVELTKMRLHPICVIQFMASLWLLTTWILVLFGFVLGQPKLYMWASRTFVVTLVIAVTPLLVFGVGAAIERWRGNSDQ